MAGKVTFKKCITSKESLGKHWDVCICCLHVRITNSVSVHSVDLPACVGEEAATQLWQLPVSSELVTRSTGTVASLVRCWGTSHCVIVGICWTPMTNAHFAPLKSSSSQSGEAKICNKLVYHLSDESWVSFTPFVNVNQKYLKIYWFCQTGF